jgi:hypothetical protein
LEHLLAVYAAMIMVQTLNLTFQLCWNYVAFHRTMW